MNMDTSFSWKGNRSSIQYWLERTAWKNLKDTSYGVKKEDEEPSEILFEDPLLRQVCLIDLATFVINEKVAVDATSASVRFAPDEEAQKFSATQVLDEARHLEVFTNRIHKLGLDKTQKDTLLSRYTTPEMQKFHDLIYEQVDKQDFLATTIALNVILEGLAAPLYKYEALYWSRLDTGMSELVTGAFRDEVQHIGFGENLVKYYLKSGRIKNSAVTKTIREFRMLIDDVFDSMVHHYINLYQEAANGVMDIVGDIEIFPGHKIYNTSEEDQVKLLLAEVEKEYRKRLSKIGLEY